MQGRDLAAMNFAIRRYLEEQERSAAYRALVTELRKAGPRVDTVIDAPRTPSRLSPTTPSWARKRGGHSCRVLRLPVPVLPASHADAEEGARHTATAWIVWKDFRHRFTRRRSRQRKPASAREQGKFWEYHDRLFQNQQALEPDLLKKYAADTGLDPAKFNTCLDTAKACRAYRHRWALAISWVSARLRPCSSTDGW